MRLSHLSIVSGTCPGSVHHTIVEIPDDGPALFSPIHESPAEPSAQGTKSSKSRLESSQSLRATLSGFALFTSVTK